MIDLRSTVQILLQDAGFRTRRTTSDVVPVLSFEDDAFLGFVFVFDRVGSLLQQWREQEARILSSYATSFRVAGDKAWNVYSIFLCTENGTPAQVRIVRSVEENLERTRKIAACGVANRSEAVKALLPLLPLQQHAILLPEDTTQRLRSRIEKISPAVAATALDETVPPSDVVSTLSRIA